MVCFVGLNSQTPFYMHFQLFLFVIVLIFCVSLHTPICTILMVNLRFQNLLMAVLDKKISAVFLDKRKVLNLLRGFFFWLQVSLFSYFILFRWSLFWRYFVVKLRGRRAFSFLNFNKSFFIFYLVSLFCCFGVILWSIN